MFTLCSNIFRISWLLLCKYSSVLFLNLGKGESDENDDSNFETFLHFEAAIIAEQF